MSRGNAGKRLLCASIMMIAFIVIAALIFCLKQDAAGGKAAEQDAAMQVVALNEIKQLAEQGNTKEVIACADKLAGEISAANRRGSAVPYIIGSSAACIFFIIAAFLYIYLAILRPFTKMEKFAEAIARGDFDQPLNYDRSDYFGKFTWAFDSMRREITKARSCEKEAIANNKTVIATLSHDIKTPISSIRAYAEGLEANLDKDAEQRAKYINTIMNKCDEVASLTNDLFIHSISDLDKLRISAHKTEICALTAELVAEIAAERGDVRYEVPSFAAEVNLDLSRYTQILENLINNARKYAKSPVDIFFSMGDCSDGKSVSLHVRDYGDGIDDEDKPFVFEKFYRGKNCSDEPGSGLGLYIVKYLMEQHHGSISIVNHRKDTGGQGKDVGTEIILTFPLIS